MKLEYTGQWNNGEFQMHNKKNFQKELKEKFFNQHVTITVEKTKKNRSNQQNRYYWACVTIVANELGYSREEMHSIIGFKFLKREKVDENSGEVFEYIESTTKLSTTDFVVFMDEFIIWSAEHLNIILPSPNEQLTIL
jgi:hypothetical protein